MEIQMTLLSETDEEKRINRILRRGSAVRNSKERIKKIYKTLDKKEWIRAVKEEYGTGSIGGPDIGCISYDSKGLEIWKEDTVETKIFLTWEQVEKRIRKMISEGTY